MMMMMRRSKHFRKRYEKSSLVFVVVQELRYTHEELLKQKTGLQNRIQEREQEIERLRNQVLIILRKKKSNNK